MTGDDRRILAPIFGRAWRPILVAHSIASTILHVVGIAVSIVLFFVSVFLVASLARYLIEPFYLTPDPDDARVLHAHVRHVFAFDEDILLRARHDGFGEYVWMAKAPDGSWSPYFDEEP